MIRLGQQLMTFISVRGTDKAEEWNGMQYLHVLLGGAGLGHQRPTILTQ